MKIENNMLVAFLLNLAFSVFELVGGILTGSVAILSDSLHDVGDAMSIGVSYLLEKKSKKAADERYTYGYGRYSVIGGAFTTLILLVGSLGVICTSVMRLLSPKPIDYEGMMIFALVGISVNLFAAYLTHGNGSVNRKAVSLHMLEDVLGWGVVLIGAVVMRFTELSVIDPLLSMFTSVVILFGAVKNMCEVVGIVTDRIPHGISLTEIQDRLTAIDGVEEIHHVHVRTIDGYTSAASMHVVTDGDWREIKKSIRAELDELGIDHITLELERVGEACGDPRCHLEHGHAHRYHHHHQHHH